MAGTGLLTPRCTLGSQHLFCEGLVPRELEERLSAVLLTADGVHRVALRPKVLGGDQRRPALAAVGLVLERALLGHGALVVVFGEKGLVCRKLPSPPASRCRVFRSGWPSTATRRQSTATTCLSAWHGPDFGADARCVLLRELQLLASPANGRRTIEVPEAALHAGVDAIVGCDEGVFVSGRLTDPHRLVKAVIIERDGVDRAIDVASTSCGFAPLAAKVRVRHRHALRLRLLRQGRRLAAARTTAGPAWPRSVWHSACGPAPASTLPMDRRC